MFALNRAVASAEVTLSPTTASACPQQTQSLEHVDNSICGTPHWTVPLPPSPETRGNAPLADPPEREIYGASDHVVRILTESPHGSCVYPSLLPSSLFCVHAYTTLPTASRAVRSEKVGEMGMGMRTGTGMGVEDGRNPG